MRAAAFAAVASLAALSGCASQAPVATAVSRPNADTGLDRMERLTLIANECWIRSGDAAFASYSLAPELTSFSGRPRFLIVPKNRPEARPLLVVEGRSGSSDVSTYGPLLDEAAGVRIRADIGRWSDGATRCTA